MSCTLTTLIISGLFLLFYHLSSDVQWSYQYFFQSCDLWPFHCWLHCQWLDSPGTPDLWSDWSVSLFIVKGNTTTVSVCGGVYFYYYYIYIFLCYYWWRSNHSLWQVNVKKHQISKVHLLFLAPVSVYGSALLSRRVLTGVLVRFDWIHSGSCSSLCLFHKPWTWLEDSTLLHVFHGTHHHFPQAFEV